MIFESLLKENEVDFEVLTHEKPIRSRNDALIYFKLEETAPTLILTDGKAMFALIISGAREKIDFTNIQKKLNCGKIAMVGRKELKEKLGMEPGEVAMVGHGLPCIIDKSLYRFDYVYGGIGDSYKTLKINPCHLGKVNSIVLELE